MNCNLKTFKKEKREELDYAKQLKDFKKITVDRFDFALFIRPDLFSTEVIDLAKKKSDKFVAYQWDGLDVYPKIYSRINLFERFFPKSGIALNLAVIASKAPSTNVIG